MKMIYVKAGPNESFKGTYINPRYIVSMDLLFLDKDGIVKIDNDTFMKVNITMKEIDLPNPLWVRESLIKNLVIDGGKEKDPGN